jgi:hypothetical protein
MFLGVSRRGELKKSPGSTWTYFLQKVNVESFSRKNRQFVFQKKNFSTRFFLQNVFELPSLRNTRKRDKTKKVEEKLTSKFFVEILEKVFDMTFCKNIFMVFLNSPCRETPKNVLKKKSRKKKSHCGWVGLGFSKCTGGSVDLFFAGPSRG